MVEDTLRTIRPPVLTFRDYLGYRLRANVISPDIFIAHHRAMSSQAHLPSNARFALCPPRPLSLPSVLFIYYVQEETTSVVASSVCMFAHACLPSLIPSLPFLAFNALSPFTPTRAKGQFIYDVCSADSAQKLQHFCSSPLLCTICS